MFRQDYKKMMAKLSILFTLASLFGMAFSWHFLRSGIPDSQCKELIQHQVTALAIGAAVGMISIVVVPLLIWKWPWTWLLVLNMIILTAILTANWGQWKSVSWQAGILVVFNIGAAIAYMRARRYAMTIYVCTAISLSVYISGKLVFHLNTPVYKRMDVLWCSTPSQCGADVGGAIAITFTLLCVNALAQHMMDKTDDDRRKKHRHARYARIARMESMTVQEEFEYERREKRQQKAEARAREKQRQRQSRIDATAAAATTTASDNNRQRPQR